MTDAPSLQDGWTPLHQAALAGHAEVVQMLLDAEADTEAKHAVRGAGDATQG
jgi:ankyrin repeat protein